MYALRAQVQKEVQARDEAERLEAVHAREAREAAKRARLAEDAASADAAKGRAAAGDSAAAARHGDEAKLKDAKRASKKDKKKPTGANTGLSFDPDEE
jgi:hypothetical protein